MLANHLLGE